MRNPHCVSGTHWPQTLLICEDMKWFVIASNRLDHVDLYRWQGSVATEPLQLVKRIPAPKTPSHLSIDSKSTTVYASLQDSDELLAIDLATQAVKWKQPVGKMPADIFLTPDDKYLLVALTGDKFVEVWDVSGATPKLVKRIQTAAGTHSFRAWGDKLRIAVVAQRLGYESEASFSRAFKRITGAAPSQVRAAGEAPPAAMFAPPAEAAE